MFGQAIFVQKCAVKSAFRSIGGAVSASSKVPSLISIIPPIIAFTASAPRIILPFVLGYLVWLEFMGRAAFGHDGWSTSLLLAAAGPATAVPLLFFAGAVTRIPLTYLGLLQYLTPSLQFILGVFLYGEPMPPDRLAGFVLIWAALVSFTGENLYYLRKLRRKALRLAMEPAP